MLAQAAHRAVGVTAMPSYMYMSFLRQRELRGEPRRGTKLSNHRKQPALLKALDKKFDGMATVVRDMVQVLDEHARDTAYKGDGPPAKLAKLAATAKLLFDRLNANASSSFAAEHRAYDDRNAFFVLGG